MADERVQTWADGFGTWHASVPVADDATMAKAAREAIRAELLARGPIGADYRVRVRRELVTNHGTAHYVEDDGTGAPVVDLDAMCRAYVACALWSESAYGAVADDGTFVPDESADASFSDLNFDETDLTHDARETMRADCADFLDAAADLIRVAGLSADQTGHDLWLTRNGHGAGFWDRGLGAIGEELSDLARPFGEQHLYVTDGGSVEVSG